MSYFKSEPGLLFLGVVFFVVVPNLKLLMMYTGPLFINIFLDCSLVVIENVQR